MARATLVLLLAVTATVPVLGFHFSSPKDYVSKLFNKISSSTEDPEILTESSEPNYDFTCYEDGLYLNPEDCLSYIKCTSGQAYVHRCPSGQHFSEESQKCEYPCDAYCEASLADECGWDACSLPKDVGPCRGMLKRYYYNRASGRCEPFTYGGCRGNANNFFFKEQCEKACMKEDAPQIHIEDSQLASDFICTRDGLYRNPGDCSTYVQCSKDRAYVKPCPEGLHFSEETESCESPCAAYCDASLADECAWEIQPRNAAPRTSAEVSAQRQFSTCPTNGIHRIPVDCKTYIVCTNGRGYVKRCPLGKHFSRDTESCENRCDAHCDDNIAEECGWPSSSNTESSDSVCSLPAVEGPCNEDIPMWHYNSRAGDCEMFTYGGCEGNANRFADKQECLAECRSDSRKQDRSLEKPLTPYLDFTCVRDGLFRNPEDCNTYIQCFGDQVFLLPCRYGLHFNEETERCESPCKAQCDESLAGRCVSPMKSVESPEECYLDFDQGPCSDNVSYYYYDRMDGVCRQFLYGGCGGNGNRFRTMRQCEDRCASKQGEYSGRGPQTSSEDSLYMSDFTCVRDGQHRNPTNCRTYIQCSNGQAYMKPCPAGLHFSEETLKCESTCDAHCDESLADECGWLDGVNHRDYSKGASQTSSDFDCVKDGLFHNPEDCTTYVQCSDGQSYVQSCPAGLHFSEETLKCESPCDAHCDDSLAEECGWTNDIRLRDYSKEASQTSSDFDCIKDGLFRNPEDCTTYVQCSNGQSYVQSCPDGQHFNEESETCEIPCDAHCDDNLAEECGWTNDIKLRGYPCNMPSIYGPCDLYHTWWYFNPSYQQCLPLRYGGCNRKGNFKSKKECEQRCLHYSDNSAPKPHISTEDTQNTSDFSCIKDGLYRNPEDCTTYIQCTNGQSYVQSCPTGLHFSEESERCEFSCDAHCDDSLAEQCNWNQNKMPDVCRLPVEKGPCFGSIKRYFFDATRGRCKLFEYGGCEGNENNFETKRDCEERCQLYREPSGASTSDVSEDMCEKDGLYPDPEDCGRFIQCSNGIQYDLPCPTGLHFSEDSQRCDIPCNAHCNKTLACQCGWPECSELEVNCEAEPLVGPCKSLKKRYYYDRDSGQCRRFIYGGCGGNTNNFVSREECKEKCQNKLLGDYQCPTPTGKFADSYDCTTYYDCKRGKPTLKRCPAKMAFDYRKWKCVFELNANCLYKCENRDGVYPYPHDCHKYIDCVKTIPKVKKCSPGEAFDIIKKACFDEDTVEACKQS